MTPRRIFLLLSALTALAACHHSYRGGVYVGRPYGAYGGGAYGSVRTTSYGSSGIVWNTPSRHVVDEPVSGSDGTFGWRSPSTAPEAELQRTTESMVRIGCVVQESTPTESRAECYGVQTLVRLDAGDAYRLCAAGTDRGVCASTWSRISH